jgi:hypothetical protein
MIARPALRAALVSDVDSGRLRPETVSGPARLRARRSVGRVAEDLLDRRGQQLLAAVRADRLRDRADVRRAALGVGAVDGRAAEARADAGLVHRVAEHADQDARPAGRRLALDDVQHLGPERHRVDPLDHRQRLALHALPDLRQRHDRLAGTCGSGERETGEHAHRGDC